MLSNNTICALMLQFEVFAKDEIQVGWEVFTPVKRKDEEYWANGKYYTHPNVNTAFKAFLRGYETHVLETDKAQERYTHYKGGKYVIISPAKHTETGETMVVYQSEETGEVFTRPYDMFFGKTEDGTQRFEPTI